MVIHKYRKVLLFRTPLSSIDQWNSCQRKKTSWKKRIMNFQKLQRKLFMIFFSCYFFFFFENHSEHVSSGVSENEEKGNERKVMEHL